MKSFFKGFFGSKLLDSGKEKEEIPERGRAVPPVGVPGRDLEVEGPPVAPYKRGDLIGTKHEVHGVLGKGGFGVVYLVYSRETGSVYALKTFRDEYLADPQTRERFRREAEVWVDLERHPYLVRAYFVDEVAGRLYIGMEYIAPDEGGLNSLEGYLMRRPPDLAQSLRWAIQFCHGMEYAYSRGIRSHRDIKPANILIGPDKLVKIADFGLAGALGSSGASPGIQLNVREGRVGLSCQTVRGAGVGTPTHMPPEQFTDAASCDERSDIYAFGVVLYQMASGGKLPFLAPLPRDDSPEETARFWWGMYQLHTGSPVPGLDSPLSPIIRRCLEKEPDRRYRTFRVLRSDLEPLLAHQTGETIRPPELKELKAWEWSNKGRSLASLGRYDEAIRCCDMALEIEPRHAGVWYNKGLSLVSLGRHDEAIRWCDRALEIDPRHAHAWNNKGSILVRLGRYDEAIRCCDRALEIDPRHAHAWTIKGASLDSLGRHDEAIRCYDRALEIDPRYAVAWYNKGNSLHRLGRYDEAIRCYDRALEIDPRYAVAWYNKGNSLHRLGRHDEVIRCYDRALEIDPRMATAWLNKALSEERLSRTRDAVRSYQRFVTLAPTEYAAQVQAARRRVQELGNK